MYGDFIDRTQKGLYIYAVKGNWQLDDSIQSKIVAMAFSMASEIDRDLISKHTTEALQACKNAGMRYGSTEANLHHWLKKCGLTKNLPFFLKRGF